MQDSTKPCTKQLRSTETKNSMKNSTACAPINRCIRVRVKFFKIFDVDISSHLFQCDFFLEASWEDDELEPSEVTVESQPAESWEKQFPYFSSGKEIKRWTPRLNFANLKEFADGSREEWYSVYVQDDGGNSLQHPVVCYKIRGTATFHTKFDLHAFPFDSQKLSIRIYSSYQDVSEKKTQDKVLHQHAKLRACSTKKMKKKNNKVGHEMYNVILEKNTSPKYQSVIPHEDNFFLSDEYRVHPDIQGHSGYTDEKMSSQNFQYPTLVLSVKLIRHPSNYFFNIVLPMFVIVLMGFPCLLLEATAFTDRLSIVLTMLLTVIAYKAYTAEMIPKVNYLTWIEKYLVFSTLLLTGLGVESTLLFWLSTVDSGSCWAPAETTAQTTAEKSSSLACYLYSMETHLCGLLSLLWCLWHAWCGITMLTSDDATAETETETETETGRDGGGGVCNMKFVMQWIWLLVVPFIVLANKEESLL